MSIRLYRRLYRVPAAVLAMSFALLPAAGAARAGTPPPEPVDAQIIGIVTDPRIDNASGLATSADGRVLYTHQDAGRSTDVFALDESGKVRYTIKLPAGTNDDWEDMNAVSVRDGGRALFMGDIGDALAVRTATHEGGRREYRLFRFDEPPSDSTGQVTATGLRAYRLRYADDMPGRNAETLLIQPGTGRVFVVDKTQDLRHPTSLWAAPPTLSTRRMNVLSKALTRLPLSGASGGAFSPTGDRLVIRNRDTAFVWWIDGGDVVASLAKQPTRVPLPMQRQGEGVCFTPDGHSLLINSEGTSQPMWMVPLPRAVDAAALPAAPRAAAVSNGRTTLIATAISGGALLVALVLIGAHLLRRS